MASETLECPFCGYETDDAYIISLHVEELHTDDSPFQVRDVSSSAPLPSQHRQAPSTCHASIQESQGGWVQCPHEDCGEEVLLEEVNEHLDLHVAEKISSEDDSSITRSSMASSSSSQHSIAQDYYYSAGNQHALLKQYKTPLPTNEKATLKRSVEGVGFSPKTKNRIPQGRPPGATDARLGKAELGPFAYESHMPAWLHRQLSTGGKRTVVTRIGRDGRLVRDRTVENEVPGLLPVLARLIDHDESVQRAYFCHPVVRHVSKLPREGGFCGYRNMQMLLSYLLDAQAPGWEHFADSAAAPGEVPGVLELQDRIEAAWDAGICELGRVQTGGIRGTRKYIGTPEVAALLGRAEIEFRTRSFHDDVQGKSAVQQLVEYAEQYFEVGATGSDGKLRKTLRPPIYLQRPGHSLTIVGFEVRKDGSRSLLVFDPMYVVSKEMQRVRDRATRLPRSVSALLRMYRRSQESLGRYRDFETVEYVFLDRISRWKLKVGAKGG
ncbi:MAG: hypothetical protein M1821_008890 [Bathelium mastoideum]|nr:MAG: hypothetical protein M1821_008890 [Bathelium mastoideum]KAI9687532.1 MAG: hypothetical protein M1822_002142 [Bathelium mastoideum]